tara:strand:+ start:420 stop:812 length:393 start_codon:yes stop_codon:yes gene_type:complete
MAFTPIETLALIIIVLTLIKMLVILKNPMTWFNKVVKPMYDNPFWLQTVGLVLIFVSLYYLLQVFTIVQIFAVMFLFAALMLVGVAPYSKDIISFSTKIYKQKLIIKRALLSIIIWVVLLLWALYELFLL